MWIRDRDRVLVRVNHAAQERLGFDLNKLIGKRSDVYVAQQDWKRLDVDWRELLRRGHWTGEREILRGDGRHVRAQLANRLALIDGEPLVLTVAIDLKDLPMSRRHEAAATDRPLTPREIEIVHYVALGRRAHEIADELGLAQSTVQTHLRNAMAKVGARSQAQLVAVTMCHGFLDSELLDQALSDQRSRPAPATHVGRATK
jgi:PAS domain S-box-containing protein